MVYVKILRVGQLSERVMILGSTRMTRRILAEVAEAPDIGFEVTALVTEEDREEVAAMNPLRVRNVLSLEEFVEKADSIAVDRIVVELADRRGKLPFQALLDHRFRGVQVEEAVSFYERLTGKIMLDNLRPSWFIFSQGFRKSKLTLMTKKLADMILAVVLVLLSSPILLLTAILIRLDSKGPSIYAQDRVGEGGRDYTLYKFRSMVEDAEREGAQWAEEDDPRITRVGRVIRKYRIDELPQLVNVLKGDMSFVGPRPERRCFIEELQEEIPYYAQRLFVKPGITGWAQIKYHYGSSKKETLEKLQYDLYYIKNFSFLFDLSIIFDTIRVVLAGSGAR
jgi:sugar transferase (PEP-CTERM system associated)